MTPECIYIITKGIDRLPNGLCYKYRPSLSETHLKPSLVKNRQAIVLLSA